MKIKSSAYDDIQPELSMTKNLQKKNEELMKQVAILKEQNESELSEQLLLLQQEVENKDIELERQIELTKMAERRITDLESQKE